MAVALDAVSRAHADGSTSASVASFTWNHTAASGARGILVAVCTSGTNGSTNYITSVTYNGVALSAVSGGAAADTVTEQGRVDIYFLGSNVPTGSNLPIVVNRTNNTTQMTAFAATVTAASTSNTAVHEAGIVLLQENGSYSAQSVTDGSPGTNSLRFVCGYYGGNAPAPVDTGNTTSDFTNDLGAYGFTFGHETTAGQGARSVGLSQVTADDRAGVHFAVKEAGTIHSDTVSESLATTSAQAFSMSFDGAASESLATTSAQSSLEDSVPATAESLNVAEAYAQELLIPVSLTETLTIVTAQTDGWQGAAFTLLSVDGDNSIYHGQSGVIILPGAGAEFAASGNLVNLEQGGTIVSQFITAESTSSITITVDATGMTVPGTANIRVLKPV